MSINPSTETEMRPLVGLVGTTHTSRGDMMIRVKIENVRVNPRNHETEVLVSPIAGSGKSWIRLYTVEDLPPYEMPEI